VRGRAPHTSVWLMLRRNLLYTAVTRAKRIVALMGSTCALARAVRTEGVGQCDAALAERLRRGTSNKERLGTPTTRAATG